MRSINADSEEWGEIRNTGNILVGKLIEKRLVGDRSTDDNIILKCILGN
jgi:hypothetical protein